MSIMNWDSWLRRWKTWSIPLLLVLVNLGLFFAHRLVVTVRLVALESELSRTTEEVAKLENRREVVETRARNGKETRDQIAELYTETLANQETRLTRMNWAVKELTRQVGMEPGSFSYPDQDYTEFGLRRMAFDFGGVTGTYEQLRELIALLENSDHYITMESISVSRDKKNGMLKIKLALSTLFAVPEDETKI